jgi:hypothetical protein
MCCRISKYAKEAKRLVGCSSQACCEEFTVDITGTFHETGEVDQTALNVDSESTFSIHKTVKCQRPIVSVNNGGKPLKKTLTLKERKELQTKMNEVFKRNIKDLSAELQGILVDDLVTAFQNRMNVLIRAQAKKSY